jgi:hypothetical protein
LFLSLWISICRTVFLPKTCQISLLSFLFLGDGCFVYNARFLRLSLVCHMLLPIKQGDPRRRCIPHTLQLWASLLQSVLLGIAPTPAPTIDFASSTSASSSASSSSASSSVGSSSVSTRPADLWTVGSAPILTAPERDLLLDTYSGLIENARGQCQVCGKGVSDEAEMG